MSQAVSTQEEVAALNAEFESYIRGLRIPWLAQNRSRSRDVYEVMDKADREEVDRIIARWKRYVTPLAEAWWKAHGYGVIWPDDDSKPMQFYKLETS